MLYLQASLEHKFDFELEAFTALYWLVHQGFAAL